MLMLHSVQLAALHHTSQSLVHAQQELLVTVLLTMVHNVFNVTLDIISQQHNHAHLAQVTAVLAQVLQTVHHVVLDIMLLLMEHVYPIQHLKTRMLKSLLQDSHSLL